MNDSPDPSTADPTAVLTEAPDPVSAEEAVEVVRRYYGVRADIAPLSGERDDNFVVRTGSQDWVLKIAHQRERPAVTAFQSAILTELSGRGLRVPAPVLTVGGQPHDWIADGPAAGRAIRMTTFLPGTLLRATPVDSRLAFALGGAAADLDVALAALPAPYFGDELLWDLRQGRRVRALVDERGEDADLLKSRLDYLITDVDAALRQLPAQVIHHDLNPDNVLVDATGADPVIGVLDFGDAVVAPRAMEVGIAASYLLGVDSPDGFLDAATALIAGYHARAALTDAEFAVLYDAMVARLVALIVIATWRANRFPDNRDYLLRNVAPARRRLHLLLGAGAAAVTEQIRQRCQPR